jgi:filamentous hemagglutinin family protein
MTQNSCVSHLRPPRLRIWLLSSGLLLVGLLATSLAQVPSAITSDNTLGTTVTQNGRVYTITGGTRPGDGPNLFHSFERFSVGTNDTARFTDPQTGIENILSRVTGRERSMINGLLQSTIPEANLYLLNPSGVVFGPNARLDVKGSFHVSTADYLRLADGATFAVDRGTNSTLTMAPPAAFGFLRENPDGITLQGSVLQVPEGETLSVVGGDIAIVGPGNPSTEAPTLGAPGGRINIASVASPGNVMLNSPSEPPGLQVDSFAHLGAVTLAQGARLDASGNSGGTVIIRGGRLVVEQSAIMANTHGGADGTSLGVDLEIAGDLVVTQGSFINADADVLSTGDAGDIRIHAGQVEVSQRALIGSRAFPGSVGDGGEVTITTGRLAVRDTAAITTGTAGEGRAGDIVAEVETLTVTGGGAVSSSTSGTERGGRVMVTATEAITVSGNSEGVSSRLTSETSGSGDAGQIILTTPLLHLEDTGLLRIATLDAGRAGDLVMAAETLQITSGAAITSITLGPGEGGNITINAPEAHLDMGQITTQTFGTGHAGGITVETERLTLIRGAHIGSDSLFVDIVGNAQVGDGATGNVMVAATDSVTLSAASGIAALTVGDGLGGQISIATPHLILDGGIIDATSLGGRRAGDVIADVGTLTMTNGARIIVNSGAINPVTGEPVGGGGGAGNIMVSATENISLANLSTITSLTVGEGAGGNVIIAGPRLTMDFSGILATTNGAGHAGDVTVDVGQLTLTGGAMIDSSSGFVSAQGAVVATGAGGTISITAEQVELNIAAISARTLGDADAGDIVMEVGSLTLDGTSEASVIRTTSGQELVSGQVVAGSGKAGDIIISARENVSLTGFGIITSATAGEGKGGNVSIITPNLHMDGGAVLATTSDTGGAGNIAVAVHQLTVAGRGQIDSSTSGAGQGGTVTVAATDAITISSFGTIASDASGGGNAGTVSLSTPILTMDGEASIEARTIGDGNAGDVLVMVEQLILTSGAQIGSTSGIATAEGDSMIGTGQAGSVTVTATDSIVITGGNSTGVVRSGLFSQTASPRQETTGAEGETAGQIVVSTPRLIMDDGGRIAADTGGDARGGNIEMQVERLSLTGGAQITSGSGIDVGDRPPFGGEGRGGSIVVRATDTVVIADQDSGLRSNTRGNGRGGNITLAARAIEVSDGAVLSAASSGAGDAGSVRILAQDTFLSEYSTVTTKALQASGGNIQVTAETLVRLQDSAITAEARGETRMGSDGGNVTIQAGFVILDHSQIHANAFGGNGGNIVMTVDDAFLADTQTCADQACLDASSQLGVAGTIAVSTPTADLSGVVTPLPQTFTSAAVLLRQRCAERLRGGEISSLVLAGRDGVPADPEGGLPSPLAEAEGLPVDGIGHAEPLGRTFASSQSLVRDENRRGLHIRGWNTLPFSQTAWDKECAGW